MASKTVQTRPNPSNPVPPTVLPTEEAREPKRKPISTLRWFFEGLASLRLTVVLFTLSFLIVFYSTVAQIDSGLGSVVRQYFRSWFVFIPIQLNIKVLQVFFYVPSWVELKDFAIPGTGVRFPAVIPFPAGFTLGFLLLFNLLAAHALRFRLTWARGGVILLHLGVILLLLGELATVWSVESSLIANIGDTANVTHNTNKVELAIIDSASDPKKDDILVVPGRMLSYAGAVVKDARLPFDFAVVRWMANSKVVTDPARAPNADISGFGRLSEAKELAEVSGVSTGGEVDYPSAVVKLTERGTGKDLGTWMFSAHLKPQNVTVGDRTYRMALRFQLVPKPYSVEVLEVRNDVYPGTSIPKNYSSRVRLVHPEGSEGREVVIWMNNPLRIITGYFAGFIPKVDTLYQSQIRQDETTGATAGTVLHVVDNSSWMLPYISCTMITLGMMWHFGFMMPTLMKRVRMRSTTPAVTQSPPDSGWLVWIPATAVTLTILYFTFAALPVGDSSDGVHYQAFGRLPLQSGGRVQPIDTMARNTLMVLSDRSETYEEKLEVGEQPKPEEEKTWRRISAIRWLLDVQTAHIAADSMPIFKIDPNLVTAINRVLENQPRKPNLQPQTLPEREKYAYNELEPFFVEPLMRLAQNMRKTPQGEWGRQQEEVIALSQQLLLYARLARHATPHRVFRIESQDVLAELGLERREGLRYALGEFVSRAPRIMQLAAPLANKPQKEWTQFEAQISKLNDKLGAFQKSAEAPGLMLIPPLSEVNLEHWYTPDEAPNLDPEKAAVVAWQSMLMSFAATKNTRTAEMATKEFNQAVTLYQKLLDEHPVPASKAVAMEQNFNSMSPFYQVLVMYVLADLLVLVGFVFVMGGVQSASIGKVLIRTAFWMAVVTVLVHTIALVVRMYLQGRPPVTNLYSSAVFIGWACVLLGLVLDVLYRTGLGTLTGCALGWITSIVAVHLAMAGDTMEMMRAVLDTNFWLATHVVAVTLGYTATLLAGFLGVVYIVMWLPGELSGHKMDADLRKTLSGMIYGVVCFAMLLSFVGTVLGGIWADQSWGRFWGWDPKENGAVLIVIWNALILHARWAGMVKPTGVAALAVAGNMVTVWSWFGTNQLGVGLHSYGFSNALGFFCMVMWVSHAAIIALLLIPSLLRLYGWQPKAA